MPTKLQVDLLKELQKKDQQKEEKLCVHDLEDCRRILTSPALLKGEWWESRFVALGMPHAWNPAQHIRQSGGLSIAMTLITESLKHTRDKMVLASYRDWDLVLVRQLCLRLFVDVGVVLLSAGRSPQRQKQIDSFNDTDCEKVRLLLLPAISGGVGITLTGANRMIVLGASWDPANDAQLSRRCWRFGQQKPVILWQIVTRGCFDSRVLERALNKEELRALVESGGSRGVASAAASASNQHDFMSELVYRESVSAPANWVEVTREHGLWTDIPTTKAAAMPVVSGVFCLK